MWQCNTFMSLSFLPLLCHIGDPSVRQASLFALSNLSFCRENKLAVCKAEGLLQMLVELAQPHASQGTSDTSRLMAVRALAVLGMWARLAWGGFNRVLMGRKVNRCFEG